MRRFAVRDGVYLYVPKNCASGGMRAGCRATISREAVCPHGTIERLDTRIANTREYQLTDHDPEPIAQLCVACSDIHWYQIPPWHAGASDLASGLWFLVVVAVVGIAAAITAAYKAS